MLTQEKLKEILSYNPDTGEFTWIKTRKDFLGTIAGSPATNGYIQIRVLGVKRQAHKLAFLWMEGIYPEYVDHKDTVITNNSWSNLRLCDRYQNAQNKKVSKNNALGIKGLCKDSFGYTARVQAYAQNYSRRFTLYRYGTDEKALDAAIDWLKTLREKLHEEFTNHG